MGEWWLSSWRTFERATASAFAHWISSLSFVSSHLGFSFDSASALKSQDSLWAHQRERGNPFPSTVRSLLSFSFNVCPKEGQTFIKRKEERRTSVRKETFHFLKKWKKTGSVDDLIFSFFSSCGALPFPSLNKPHMKRKRKERKWKEVILTNPVFHDPSHFFSLFNSRWQLNPFFFSYELPDDY